VSFVPFVTFVFDLADWQLTRPSVIGPRKAPFTIVVEML
jgi:hypothetical protein